MINKKWSKQDQPKEFKEEGTDSALKYLGK